jgi:hypothetical protein
MLTRLSLLCGLLLSLTACGLLRGKDVRPATDLQVLRLGVQALTEPRTPAGDVQRLEDAATVGQAWDYAGDLEDALWLSNRDKANLRQFVNKATAAIEASRLPECRWFQPARDGVCRR